MKHKLVFVLLSFPLLLACFFGDVTPLAIAATPPMTAAPVVYLSTPTPTQQPVCLVTVKALNLRSNPGVDDSNVLAWLHQGDAVTILDDKARGEWLHIRTGNITGWIHSKYCERKN
jgi:uncharacterized protein YgiM (DUF1202 family)